MSYCLKPGCQNPQTADRWQFCLSCGSKLLLKERYRPIQPLARGGFGRTFLAVDEDIPSKPYCVVKQLYFLDQNPEYYNKAVELFRQEAFHLNALGTHPQIPSLLAYFEQEQRLYLVQELIDGQTLEQELQQGAFDESQIWELLEDLLPVLKFIHTHQVIHRDIKPENIMRRRGNSPRETLPFGSASGDRDLVLIDFGSAKHLTDTALLRQGTAIGSQEYAAPEQAKGKAFPASDLYSLGVTCIRLLTNVPPLDMYDIDEHRWWWRHHLPKGRSVSDRLGQILDNLLQHSISQRYSCADEVLPANNIAP